MPLSFEGNQLDFYALATDYQGVIAQGKVIGSSWGDFGSFVKDRQSMLGIPDDGILNYKTLSLEASRNIHWFRNHRYEDISVVPRLDDLTRCTIIDVSNLGNYVTVNPVIDDLLQLAEKKQHIGKYGDAALLYNEVHARSAFSKEIANYSAYATFESVGKILGIRSPVRCDPEQGKYVLTGSMVTALEEYQEEHGILPTGKLNYKTIRSFSDFGVGDYLSSLKSWHSGVQR